MYATCPLGFTPLREHPTDRSEMLSQILFGEIVMLLQEKEKWVFVESILDKYKGWVEKINLQNIEDPNCIYSVADRHMVIKKDDESLLPIPLGSLLHHYDSFDKTCNIGGTKYFSVQLGNISSIQRLIEPFLNTPYLWGGKSSYGIDCSGLTQVIYRVLGVNLKRDASQQIEQGKSVFFDEKKEGDLAFFSKNGTITHVGIILDNNLICHASGSVRIDSINRNGIIKTQTQELTHKLHTIRRVL